MKELDLIKKKRILIVTISIGLLLTILIGAAVAYMAPKINGTEASSTIVFNSGTVAIVYENGENQINANDVLPGWTAIKKFSLTAKNNTTVDSGDAMSYELKLVVEKNTFSDGAITYSIEGENTNNNGTVAYVLPNTLNSGASKVSLGYGTFDTSGNIENGVVHNYTLTLAFPNKTYTNQNSDMGKQLSAYITIEKPGELVDLTIIDEQRNINKTVKFEKNSTYELPIIASKAGAYFSGWNVESGNATINGNKITINGNASIKAKYSSTNKIEFTYTGNNEKFVAPVDGKYKLETWGAQGGGFSTYESGYGGYSFGIVSLNKNDVLYINVGGKGTNGSASSEIASGGYNGGGNGGNVSSTRYNGGGGGATHIATVSGLLSTLNTNQQAILIVAGGGGGVGGWEPSKYQIRLGGSGGGFNGVDGEPHLQKNDVYGVSGKQTESDSGGTFGQGRSYKYVSSYQYGIGGGGGGFYGGGVNDSCGGGGGSGYIGNSLLTNKSMYCYNCTESSDESTKTVSTTCHSETPTSNCAKSGNGYARITLPDDSVIEELSIITIVSEELKKVTTVETQKGMEITLSPELSDNYVFYEFELESGLATINGTKITPNSDKVVLKVKYKNKVIDEYAYIAPSNNNIEPYYTFTAPIDENYKIEVWGAQGGSAKTKVGGYGGYSAANIYLKKGQTIYIYVGGAGTNGTTQSSVSGGYNGGGNAFGATNGKTVGSGGGATFISLTTGLLNTLSNKLDNLIIVSGGGGGASYESDSYSSDGGSGGGIQGATGIFSGSGTGGSQTAAGTGQTAGSFGQGGSSKGDGSGGGGGLYGGGGGLYYRGGGGGSGYIGNTLLTNKVMYCYNCTESNVESTKTLSTTCHSETPTSNCAKEGNGYARITYAGEIKKAGNITVTIVDTVSNKTTTLYAYKGKPIDMPNHSSYDNYRFDGYVITDGKGNITNNKLSAISDITIEARYSYTGSFQFIEYDYVASTTSLSEPYYTFTAPIAGTYKLEAWGAQGGGTGGTGGYSSGTINLNRNDSLYVYVGGAGSGITGGYNGGGTALTNGFGGGGATHIATSIGKLNTLSSSLNSIIIVAGGGGGKGNSGAGGNAGGLSGNNGIDGACSNKSGGGATQTAGGKCVDGGYCNAGSFGIGGNGKGGNNGGAGGGGYYGGGAGTGGNCYGGGGGGSSYIGNTLLTNKVMYCYNCTESSAEGTKTVTTTCHSETPTSNCAKEGNGYAKITLIP